MSMARASRALFQPCAGAVFLGSELFGHAAHLKGMGAHAASQSSRECPCECGGQIKGLNAALVDQPQTGAALGGPGNFSPLGEKIVEDRVFKACVGDFCGGSRSGLGDDACISESGTKRRVNKTVRSGGRHRGGARGARKEQRIGEIVAMQDDSAAGPAADGIAPGMGGADGLPALEVPEGDGGAQPAVNTENGALDDGEKGLVNGHVERGPMGNGVVEK